MINFNENNEIIEEQVRSILVGVERRENIDIYMEELAQLTKAVGGEVLGVMTQKLEKIDSSTYIGKGKVEELVEAVENLEANTVIFNDELSGMQIRNLEERLGVRVIDRTILILDIFATRAISKEGKLQVELAQLEYRMPRLLGFGKSLSRQGGGIGTKGPGEKKLEVDKRHIRKRIDDIRRELKEVKSKRSTQRQKREKADIPVVALVGYTNVGKSAIMNNMIKDKEDLSYIEEKSVSSKDMLFETLDIQQRSIKLENNKEFILIDTVGFISKLPHHLVNAFKSTLEEVLYADLLLNVVDISYENYQFQRDVAKKVIADIGGSDKEMITVYNKIDKIEENFESTKENVYISAIKDMNMDVLRKVIEDKIFSNMVEKTYKIPFNRGDILSFAHQKGKVLSEEYDEEGTIIRVILEEKDSKRIEKYVVI